MWARHMADLQKKIIMGKDPRDRGERSVLVETNPHWPENANHLESLFHIYIHKQDSQL